MLSSLFLFIHLVVLLFKVCPRTPTRIRLGLSYERFRIDHEKSPGQIEMLAQVHRYAILAVGPSAVADVLIG